MDNRGDSLFTLLAALLLFVACSGLVFVGMEWVSPYWLDPQPHLTMATLTVLGVAATTCGSRAVNDRHEDRERARFYGFLGVLPLLAMGLALAVAIVL